MTLRHADISIHSKLPLFIVFSSTYLDYGVLGLISIIILVIRTNVDQLFLSAHFIGCILKKLVLPISMFKCSRVPEVGGRGGAESAPPQCKNNVINIHISLNLRGMKKENDKFVILMQ